MGLDSDRHGAAEEMDQDGAEDGGREEPPTPDGWWKMTEGPEAALSYKKTKAVKKGVA